jgi:hypothetical protein
MPETVEFIQHDFNLPNHDNELSEAGDIIEKLKYQINTCIENVEIITDKEFVQTYENVVRALDYVGRLSMTAFSIEDEMEELYKFRYLRSPELGKQLFFDHYENVHRPYNILKNRCFKLLDEWDNYYKALYDKDPPNWKI